LVPAYGASVDTNGDRFGSDVVRDGPVPLPHVDHEIERVVRDIDAHDPLRSVVNKAVSTDVPSRPVGERPPKSFMCFQCRQNVMKPRPLSLGVEREVLVDEVDAVPKIRELNGELPECLETADAEAGGAVEEKVLREDRVPPMELDALKAFIELVRQGVCRGVVHGL
jgi:hypothetical protein